MGGLCMAFFLGSSAKATQFIWIPYSQFFWGHSKSFLGWEVSLKGRSFVLLLVNTHRKRWILRWQTDTEKKGKNDQNIIQQEQNCGPRAPTRGEGDVEHNVAVVPDRAVLTGKENPR